MTIEKMIEDLLEREGGYVNDPADAGGETMYGITVAVARANGYEGDMKLLPESTAAQIYKNEYWVKPGYSNIFGLFPELAEKLFDYGVNCGQGKASETLQRCLSALNNQGKDYPDLVVDGHLGPVTLEALTKFLVKRKDEGKRVLLFMVAAVQGTYYLQLAETRPANEKFIWAWERHRALYNAIL